MRLVLALIAEAVQSGELVEVEKVTELDKRQCAACGVYLCAGKDFTGQCYWGCYPPRKLVEVDDYWRTHIASVGPDKGCYCTIGTPYVGTPPPTLEIQRGIASTPICSAR